MSVTSSRNKDGWSEIPVDLFFLIINQKQLSLADIARMATVCKFWGSILHDNHWFGLHFNSNIGKTSFPWLMLAESSADNDVSQRGFLNPATRQVSNIYLPEAEGRRCCGLGFRWIITMGVDMEINLLNPLTMEQFRLPSQLTFDVFSNGSTNKQVHNTYSKKELRSFFLRKAILTCNPNASECLVVVIFWCDEVELACTKPGDSTWTLLPFPPLIIEGDGTEVTMDIDDLIFYGGHLFAVNHAGALMVLENLYDYYLMHPKHKWQVINLPDLYHICKDMLESSYNFYLAEMAGELISIVRGNKLDRKGNRSTQNLVVFKLHNREWVQIDDLGDCCLFLSRLQSDYMSLPCSSWL